MVRYLKDKKNKSRQVWMSNEEDLEASQPVRTANVNHRLSVVDSSWKVIDWVVLVLA